MTETPKPDTQALIRQARFSLVPSTLGEAKEIATMIANSDFAPKDYKGKPDNVVIAIQMGSDLGLKPMQALQNIAVINGRPSIYGDAALALVQSTDKLERFHEVFEGTFPEDGFTAVCIVKRKGFPDEFRSTFSIADAKAAKLWGKRGHTGGDTPWITYPKRMLQMRARGFALRDSCSDMLLGLVLAEEAQDYGAIEGQVLSSEVVEPRELSLLDRLPEAMRDNVEKAFSELNLSPGLRLAKINEHMGGDGVDPEAGAQDLLNWLRDEFAKRKTGQPRAKKPAGNGKTTKGSTDSQTASTPESVSDQPAASAGGGEEAPPAAPAKPEEKTDAPPAAAPVEEVDPIGELF